MADNEEVMEEPTTSWYDETDAHLAALDKKAMIAFGLGAGGCLLALGANFAIVKALKMLQGIGEVVGAHDNYLRGQVNGGGATTSRDPVTHSSGMDRGDVTRVSSQDAGAIADVAGTRSIIHMDRGIDETIPPPMETDSRTGPESEISEAARDALENDLLNPGSLLHGDTSLAPRVIAPLWDDENGD